MTTRRLLTFVLPWCLCLAGCSPESDTADQPASRAAEVGDADFAAELKQAMQPLVDDEQQVEQAVAQLTDDGFFTGMADAYRAEPDPDAEVEALIERAKDSSQALSMVLVHLITQWDEGRLNERQTFVLQRLLASALDRSAP